MKITGLEIYRVAMDLVYPFRTAFGNANSIETLLVRLSAGSLSGWGEAAPWMSPGYSSECAVTAFRIIDRFLTPLVLGQDIQSGEQLQQLMKPVKGNYFAKAAVDTAWWDMESRKRGEPLWQTLGGKRDTVDVGADFGIMESIDKLIETIEQALASGFKRIKLKYRPGWELTMIEAVRASFPEAVFHVDCNSAYTLDDAEMLTRLDDYDLAMIEQPLMHDDLIDHAELQKRLSTPICLDESITSAYKAQQAARINACGWINIKPGRVGGLTNAIEIHNICKQNSIPCWVGGMLESALGTYQCLALATLDNFTYPNDIFPSSRFYARDICEPEAILTGPSQMKAIDAPGTGVEPCTERLSTQLIEMSKHED